MWRPPYSAALVQQTAECINGVHVEGWLARGERDKGTKLDWRLGRLMSASDP